MTAVTINLPDRVWGRLASVAARRDTTVPEVISDAILSAIGRTEPDHLSELEAEVYAARTQRRDHRVMQLHERGLSDIQIAKEMGIAPSTAQRYRNRLGLPAIGLPGRPAKKEQAA